MTTEVSSFKEDLKRAGRKSPKALLYGFLASPFHPYLIPEEVKEISKDGVKDFSDFAAYFSGFLGYGIGVLAMGKLVVENYDNPLAWIPVVTNIVSGAAQYSYNRGRRDERENLNLDKSGLVKKAFKLIK